MSNRILLNGFCILEGHPPLSAQLKHSHTTCPDHDTLQAIVGFDRTQPEVSAAH